jgi:HTH-type transcriptional regulator/antitoxin HigA
LARRDFLIQYRSANKDIQEKNIINSNAWVQTALNIGADIDVGRFDMKLFKKSIVEIRDMTLYDPPIFLPKLKTLLIECGVALVILPHLKNSGVNGAVKWIGKDKVILAINDRNKFADVFWFSLFHEFGHVLQKRVAMLIVSGNYNELIGRNDLMNDLEIESDNYAKNTLIPEKDYSIFISYNNFSEKAIRKFAEETNIQFGIVLGRLQNDSYVGYETKMNSLKKKYYIV